MLLCALAASVEAEEGVWYTWAYSWLTCSKRLANIADIAWHFWVGIAAERAVGAGIIEKGGCSMGGVVGWVRWEGGGGEGGAGQTPQADDIVGG